MISDIFISYSRKDLEFVTKLHTDLTGHGLKAWFDQSSINAGDQWRKTIVQGIKACQVFLIVLSPDSVQSPNVRKELDLADTFKRPILPLMYRDTSIPDTLSFQLAGLQYQLFSDEDYQRSLDRLLTALDKLENGEAVPTAEPANILPYEPVTVMVPAGPFLMGSESEADVPAYEKPQHKVELQAFRIGQYPLTVAQYAEFVQQTNHPAPQRVGWFGQKPPQAKLDHPVVGVNWYDAIAYCRWLTAQTGRSYHLPTEAEWEKAARGEDGRKYPWGNEWDPSRCNHASGKTTSVGAYPTGQSIYGCFDMIGNVWEWTSTLWGSDWQTAQFCYPYRSDDERNNLEADSTFYRLFRGGDFDDEVAQLTCTARRWYAPDHADKARGFRVVLEIRTE